MDKYYAVIYHGGSNYGRGSITNTRLCMTEYDAEKEGAALALDCKKKYGGEPFFIVHRTERD